LLIQETPDWRLWTALRRPVSDIRAVTFLGAMSENQRVITKYVHGLSRPISVQYHLHFLRDQTDSAAGYMLSDAIRGFARDSGN
jgi:hypothetical protein